MNNSELIVRALEQAGVRWVFGVPSGPVLPLIDSLRRSAVQFILTASETSAGFMAAAVGYLTGIPGVCVSTVGPGATNLATGVGCAWLDRVPLLAITCNVATPWLERRIQMRIDHHALFRPLTKATFPLRRSVEETLREAMAIAAAEPPGPVHVDLPEDVALAEGEEGRAAPAHARALEDRSEEIKTIVAAALAEARRPLVVTGLGFTRAKNADSLLRFVERQGLPFVSTMHAKGFLPESHPNWMGVVGRARRSDVKAFTDLADLLVAIGYDPIEFNYEEWAGKTPIIHISSEAAEAGENLNLIWNKPSDLDGAIAALSGIEPLVNEWSMAQWKRHRGALEQALRPSGNGFAAHQVLDILREQLPRDAILAYDVGAHTHQIATQWRSDVPRTLLSTNGWSSMGYGMPAAFAAKLVHPERRVVAVVGDGGFQMTVGELALARRSNLAVATIVLNDGWLGLMKVKQERKNYPFSGVKLGAPVDSPSHYFGVPCRPAKTPEEFRGALEWSLGLEGPSVIEAFVDVEAYSATVFD